MRALTGIASCANSGCGKPTVNESVIRVPYSVVCTCESCSGVRVIHAGTAVLHGPPFCDACGAQLTVSHPSKVELEHLVAQVAAVIPPALMKRQNVAVVVDARRLSINVRPNGDAS